jgi:SAM-dependent methyltransferase
MDFLLTNQANSNLHSSNYLELVFQFGDTIESIDSVIDVGCADGHDSLYWAEAGVLDDDDETLIPLNINVTAIDKENTFSDENKHENIKFIQTDWMEFKPKDGHDVVWAHNVLHLAQDPLQFLHQLNRYCNPGGMLCLSFPTTVNTFYGEPDYRIYSQAQHHITMINLIHMLVLSGFNCNDGYFLKQPNSNVINALVYKETDTLYNYNEIGLYELNDMFPAAVQDQLTKFGYITNKNLLLTWLTGTHVDYSSF